MDAEARRGGGGGARIGAAGPNVAARWIHGRLDSDEEDAVELVDGDLDEREM